LCQKPDIGIGGLDVRFLAWSKREDSTRT